MPFKSLGLLDQLVQGVHSQGYQTPTEIQSRAIPVALSGRDIIGRAQTGTGKTAVFILAILQRLSAKPLSGRGPRPVRALIVTPTRELALQNEEFAIKYGKYLHLRSLAVFGGVSMHHQLNGLRNGVDIVIATPGRLLDHMQRRTISLSQVEVLVLDEADRMLDMGFIDDVRRIISAVPRERQTMLFSATMPPEVRSLAVRYMKDPVTVESGEERNPIETISQKVYRVARDRKTDLLIELLKNPEMKSVLVFSRTRHGADRITRRLEHAGMRALAIHSDLNQSQRLRALEGFKRGHCQALVATEIASRGIDVEGIDCVINYDVPEQPENYIHRIGRTGRAEHEGDAITFVAFEEEPLIKQIERFIGKKLERLEHPDFPPEFQTQKPTQQFEQRAGASMRQGSSGRRFSKRGHNRRTA